MTKCNYCGNDRDGVEGWHDCSQATDAKARIEASIEDMQRIATNSTPSEVAWDVDRKKRMGDIAQNIRITGGQTKPMGGDDE